jgi:hypothetical protein
MSFNETKFFYYDEYCKTCRSKELDEEEEPCATCIIFCIDPVINKPYKYVED